MEFRMVTPDHQEQVKELWDYCFEKADTPFYQWYFSRFCFQNNMVLGGFKGKNGPLLNMLHLNPYKVQLRGREELMPYIVGVATAPEFRGHHLTKPLLEMAFKILRGQHFSFALLKPIQAGIYLKYGFSFCYFKRQYRMPLRDLTLRPSAADTQVVRLKELSASYFAPVYAAFAARHTGMPLRTPFQWQKLLTVHHLEKVQAAAAYTAGKLAGYMFYTIQNGLFTILELLATEADARLALLHYVKSHLSSAEELLWSAPQDDLTYLDLADQSLSGQTEPYMMVRCLNAAAALQALTMPPGLPEGELTLLLTDKMLPLNNHLLKIVSHNGTLSLGITEDQEDAAMDMAAFAQLYFGAFSAEELVRDGRIRCSREDKLKFLSAMLPKQNNFMNEEF